MKKTFAITMLLMMVFVSTNAQDQQTKEAIKGIWNYTAEEASYEYQSGKMHFYEEGGAFKAKIEIQGYFIHTQNLKIERNKLSCSAYVENELVTIKLNLKDGKLDGNVDTSEGVIPVSLVKEEKKN